MKKIMVLDGHSIAFRAFYAIPELQTSSGVATNAVYGFVNMLMKIVSQYSPNAVFVAFDLKAPTFRHNMFSEYKAGRSSTPETLLSQIDILKNLLTEMGITVLSSEGFEADDILGTLSEKAAQKEIMAYLVTGDKDSLQLIKDNTTVLYTKSGVTGIIEYDENEFVGKYGIKPTQFVDCKALMGDKSDNIPGVLGIGEKGAIKLLQEYKDLDGIYSALEGMKASSLKTKLEEGRESAYLSQTLARIVTNAPVELPEIGDEPYAPKPTEALCNMLKELELTKVLSSIQKDEQNTQKSNSALINAYEIGIEKLLEDIKASGEVNIFADSTDGIIKEAVLIWTGNNIYYAQKPYIDVCRELKTVLCDGDIKKYLQDIKLTMHTASKLGFEVRGAEFDYSVAAYLLDAVNCRRDIDYMATKYIGSAWQDDISSLCKLYENMKTALADEGMLELYDIMEHPLIEVLFDMEKEGVSVDLDILKKLGEEYDIRLADIKKNIFELADAEFNINSTKQLGEILFEKMHLPIIKKTKTGYSTDNEVLEQLMEAHDIIPWIVSYRQLAKLKSTYIDGLTACADEASKIHTTFNQTVTATGRLSSTEPNLQNIPVRTEEGAQIRRAFISGDEDYVIADADYSQIELRMFAHMSGDENFINAFINGEDIHRKTASDVFGIPYDEVTDSQRSHAKAVNFGIIYGISDFGLAKNISVSRNEAKKIINDYMLHFPTIENYMKSSVAFARSKGYCITMFGRKRLCADINSKNFMIRSGAERIAVNMPVQGSAADVIKIAMIKVYNELKSRGLRSKLILQVHDELLVKAHKDELDEVKLILKNCMEGAVTLEVPLVADVGSGANWNEAK